MPLPWLRLIDGVIGAADIARWVKGRSAPSEAPEPGRGLLEQRLASAVVGALGEVFDRDRERLELERRRSDDERVRAERALRLEILRQTGDREIGRLRLMSAMALASLLGSMLLAATTGGGAAGARAAVGLGCLLLILALAAAFAAQSEVGRVLARGNDRASLDDVTLTFGGIAAPWLIVAGLAGVALGLLLT